MATMQIDPLRQKLLTIEQAAATAAFHKPGGKPAHTKTVRRAMASGRRSVTGEKIRLPSTKVSSGTRTSAEAIEWWLKALNGQA